MPASNHARLKSPAAVGRHRPAPIWSMLARHGASALVRLWQTLIRWRQRAVGRQLLRDADAHTWRDLGYNRVAEEVSKPFWRE